jgi:hypothetical protein
MSKPMMNSVEDIGGFALRIILLIVIASGVICAGKESNLILFLGIFLYLASLAGYVYHITTIIKDIANYEVNRVDLIQQGIMVFVTGLLLCMVYDLWSIAGMLSRLLCIGGVMLIAAIVKLKPYYWEEK